MAHLPDRVSITEVGLRDGLQIEKRTLCTGEKLALARALIEAGHTSLEALSLPRAYPSWRMLQRFLLRYVIHGE